MTATIAAPATRRARSYAPTGTVGQHLARARALQLQIQELTALYDTERAWLQKHMAAKGLTNVELGALRCVLKQRNRWTYSEATQLEMERLAVTQKWEQAKGIAANNPTCYTAISEASK